MNYNGYTIPSVGDNIFVVTHQEKKDAIGRMRKTKELYLAKGSVTRIEISGVSDNEHYDELFISFGGEIFADGRMIAFTEGNYETDQDKAEEMLKMFKEKGMKPGGYSILDRGIFFGDGTKIQRHNLKDLAQTE